MLASWVWSIVTLFFFLGIKKYRPAKRTLPSLMMAWSTVVFLVSFVLFIDGIVNKSDSFTWEPMVLSLGIYLFCLPLYFKYLELKNKQKKSSNKKPRASA